MGLKISIAIITLWRSTLYKTLNSLFLQEFDYPYEIVCVLQWTVDIDKVRDLNIKNIPIQFFNYEKWLWFGYYRNEAVAKSSWDILVWIDDDEWTEDNNWLLLITKKIISHEYSVVTSGCNILLGKWYITDCISMLWYPGGWALWYDKIWEVTTNQTTKHLCAGNFAIRRDVMLAVNFSNLATLGWEDNALSQALSQAQIKIYYEPWATVFHIHRNFTDFLSWAKLRSQSLYFLKKHNFTEESLVAKKIRFIKNIFRFDKYFFGKFFIFLILLYFTFLMRIKILLKLVKK